MSLFFPPSMMHHTVMGEEYEEGVISVSKQQHLNREVKGGRIQRGWLHNDSDHNSGNRLNPSFKIKAAIEPKH